MEYQINGNGTRVAYSANTGPDRSDWEVFLVDVETAVSQQVTTNPGADWAGTWALDGSYLLISSEVGGNWDIYAIRPDGTERLRISCHDGDVRAPA